MRGLQSEADLQKSLQQAGFKDVQVQAQSYVVHAMGPNGSPVVMVVTPDSITGLVANPPQTAQLPTLDQNNDQNDNDQNDGLPGESQDDSGGLRQQD
jgi:hypothetical protein